MEKLELKWTEIDPGFCRIYFKDINTKQLYCIQDDSSWGNILFNLYECSKDGEPSHVIPWKQIKEIQDPAILAPESKLAMEVSRYLSNVKK